MIDLEEEFQILMDGIITQINDKTNTGKLSFEEGSKLREMVEDRLGKPLNPHNVHHRYYEPACPEGHTDPDCGWSASMGYHCY